MRRLTGAVLVSAVAGVLMAAPAAAANAAATGLAAEASNVTIDPADLAVTVAGSPDTTGPGSTITYQISVANGGPGPAPGAGLSVQVPSGTAFASFAAPADWTGTTPAAGGTGTVTATRPSLAPGAPETFTLVLTANPGIADGTTVHLSAVANSTATDPNPQNNTATATTQIRNAADLALTVAASPDPVVAATDLHYRITLANAGPAAAAHTSLTMTTPAGTAFTSFAAPSGWTSTAPPVGAGGIVTSTAGSLPVGGPVTFDLVVKVLANTGHGTPLRLAPAVTSATPDPASGNNSATATAGVANAADLAVKISDDRDPVDPAATVTYAITLTNNGPAPAASPTLSVGIGAGTGFSSFTAPAGWTVSAPPSGATGTVTATATTLASAATATFALVVTGGSAGEISLTATANTPTTDPESANDSVTETTAVLSPSPTPPAPIATKRGGLPLNGTSLVRLGGAAAVVAGLGLFVVALHRSRRARRGYR